MADYKLKDEWGFNVSPGGTCEGGQGSCCGKYLVYVSEEGVEPNSTQQIYKSYQTLQSYPTLLRLHYMFQL